MKAPPILPGSRIGVLGSGQLGRMFAIAARRMGYRVHTYSPDYDTPTGQVADIEVRAPYDDLDAVRKFAREVDVVTFEFENVPSASTQAASEIVPVRPDGSVLHVSQNRKREKTFLAQNGFPVAPFALIHSAADLLRELERIGRPAVLKSAGFGYDGKGQAKIGSDTDLDEAWRVAGAQEAVLEAFIDFEREVSVVAARGADGQFEHFGVVENDHRNHILDVTTAPADLPAEVAGQAVAITRSILETLGVVGVLCVEFFLDRRGRLLVNELAPRTHNSGHFTFDACVTSQFEQQLRAVCALPLGSPQQLRPAAMANLLGDIWAHATPDWEAVCAMGDIKIHVYGKAEARPGRKMGHLTALADSAPEAARRVRQARASLTIPGGS
jgi:5-(carboxyamino)imidazole ribonucleotide synthase